MSSPDTCAARRRLVGLLMATAACHVAHAGGPPPPVTDLSVSVQVEPAQEIYPPGTSAQIRITMSNHGPDDSPASYVGMSSFAYGGLNSQVNIAPNEQTAPCFMNYNHLDAIPGFHGYLGPNLHFPAIAADDSFECVALLEILDTGRGEYLLRVGAVTIFIDGARATDPNDTNNLDEVLVQITPPDAPPPETNLIAELIPVDPQPLYPPGSDFNVELRVHNAGPDDAGGATFDWNLDHLEADSPIALLSRRFDEGGHGPCTLRGAPAETPPFVGILRSRFPGLLAGETMSCFARVLVHPGATGHFQISGVLTTEPDFGDPTFDPDLSNNSPSFGGAISFPAATPQPAVVPGPGPLALLLLGVLALVAGTRALRAAHRR